MKFHIPKGHELRPPIKLAGAAISLAQVDRPDDQAARPAVPAWFTVAGSPSNIHALVSACPHWQGPCILRLLPA